MKILVFSEEYVKVTKGMFVVWTNQAYEAAKTHQVTLLLNHEHWAFDEAKKTFQQNTQVAVDRLPFDLPSTFIKKLFVSCDNIWLLRAMRFGLGQILNFFLCPLVILYLALRLRQLKPAAVFSHNGGWPAGQLCRWIIMAAMLANVPKRILIVHSHPAAPLFRVSGLLWQPLKSMQAWFIDKCATSIVTVSDSVKKALEDHIFKKSVTRIHNGIQLSSHIKSDHSPLNWSPTKPTVGFVGALYHMKGPHVLLDAFKLIETPSELALLGPTLDQNYLELLKQKAQLCRNKVSFLGFHPDVDFFMEKIDLLVVPAIAFESFGMVILEAMKHKKPVICSDFGGMKEVVQNNVTGLIVPTGNEFALAEAITKLLKDPKMRTQMGEAGYLRLNELFTAEKMAAQYDALIF